MSSLPDWLPEPLSYADFNGDWDKFIEAVYQVFKRDFIESRPKCEGIRVVHNGTIEDSKEKAFWHVTSVDTTEGRVPDLRRSERIAWLRPIIENANDTIVKKWYEKRGGENRLHLWLEECDFLVVLVSKPRIRILVTSFYIDRDHTRRKLKKKWEQHKAKAAP